MQGELIAFFKEHMDYVFFYYGFAFITLSTMCFMMKGKDPAGIKWTWLGIFAIAHGINEWIELTEEIFYGNPVEALYFELAGTCLLVFSFFALMEFARRNSSYKICGKKALWAYAFVFILVLSGWVIAGRMDGVKLFSRYFVAFPAGIWLSGILFSKARERETNRIPLMLLSATMIVYSVCTGLIAKKAAFFPVGIIDQEIFFTTFAVPIQAVRGVLAFLMCMCVWSYREVGSDLRQTSRRYYKYAVIVAVALTLTAGWFFLGNVKRDVDWPLREQMKKRIGTIAKVLDENQLSYLADVNNVENSEEYRLLKQQLINICRESGDIRNITVVGLKGVKPVIFIAGGEPVRPLWENKEEIIRELVQALSSGGISIEGPLSDGKKKYFSLHAVMRASQDPAVMTGFMEAEMDATFWAERVATEQKDEVAKVFLFSLAAILFFFFIQKGKELTSEISESEKKLVDAQKLARIGGISYDTEGDIIFLSKEAAEILGFDEARAVNYGDLKELVHPEDRQKVEVLRKDIREKGKAEGVARAITAPNKVKYLVISGKKAEKEGVAFGTIQDITDLKKAEDMARDSETKLKAIFDAAETISFIITDAKDPEPTVLEFSPGAERIFGYKREEIVGKKVSALHLKADVARFSEAHKNMRENRTGFDGETILVRKNGEKFPAIFSTYPLFNLEGEMYAALGVSIDISDLKRVQDEVIRSKERLSKITSAVPSIVYQLKIELNGNMSFLFISDAMYKIVGVPPQEGVKDFYGVWNVVLDEEKKRVMDKIILANQTLLPWVDEFRVMARSGEIKWMRGEALPEKQKDGSIIWNGTLSDVTEQKAQETKIKKINECFLNFVPYADKNTQMLTELFGEIMGASSCVYNRYDGKKLIPVGKWNMPGDYFPVATKGHVSFDIIDRNSDKVFYINNIQETEYFRTDPNVTKYGVKSYLGQVVKSNGRTVGAISAVFKEKIYFSKNDEKLLGIIVSAIGREEERRNFMETLEESEAQFRTMVVNMPGAVYRCANDKNWTMQYISEGIFDITGYPATDFFNNEIRTYPSIIHPEDKDLVNEEVSEGKETYSLEYRIVRADGAVRWVYERGQAIKGKEGKIEFLDGVIFDVTDRKDAENAVKESEKLLTSILDFLPDATFGIDNEGKVIFWNRAMEQMTGVPAFKMLGKKNKEYSSVFYGMPRPILIDLVLEKTEEITKKYHKIKVDGDFLIGETYIPNFMGGKYLWGVATKIKDKDGKIKGAIESIRDISEHRKAEEALRNIQIEQKAILDNIPDMVWLKDMNHRFRAVNQAFLKIGKIEKIEIVGKDDFDLWPKEFAEQYRKDDEEVISTGKEKHIEERLVGKGGQQRWIDTIKKPIYNDKGQIVGTTGTARDITERKHVEEILKAAKKHADMASEAKSRFLATMSHEIRTPMNAILGFSELLLARSNNLDETQRDYLTTVIESGKLLMSLINDILDISKIEASEISLEMVEFNLDYLIENVVKMMRPRVKGSDIDIVYYYKKGLPKFFKGDPTRIRQIFLNLLGNAIKFTNKGEITIDVDVEAPKSPGETGLKISVKDTGIGIPKEKVTAIFEPFFQIDQSDTRKYGGAGLGLSIVRALVNKMDGKVWAESEEGKGSTFIFTLRLDQVPEKETGLEPASIEQLMGKKVLIMDGNKAVQFVLRSYCEEYKMNILHQACTIKEVLSWLSTAKTLPDVILSELSRDEDEATEINGYDMARFIKGSARLKNIKIVAITSTAKAGSARECYEAGFEGYISKPVLKNELIEVIKIVFGKHEEKGIVTRYTAGEAGMGKGIRKILVAEDNPENLKLICAILDEFGYFVDTAQDGKAAVEKTRKNSYDAILMDIQMPVMDGNTATKTIRETDKNIPIFGLTASVMAEDRQAAILAGMNEFLAKPLDRKMLKEILEKWLGIMT